MAVITNETACFEARTRSEVMAYFFAYGCELNRPHVLAQMWTGNAYAERNDGQMRNAPRQPASLRQDADPSSATAGADVSLLVPSSVESSATAKSSTARLRDYSLTEPIATGYIPNKGLVYRRRQDEHAEPLIDINDAPGERLWGLLFDLPLETLSALCREFDPERTCELHTAVISITLSANSSRDENNWLAAGELIEVKTLQATSPTIFPASPVKSIVYGLLPTYLAYRAPMYALRALLGYKVSQVDSIRLNGRDTAERLIEEVYYKSPAKFAIYRTSERVAVQYADESSGAEAQRSKMASINPLRSQIAGLIDGWSKSDCEEDRHCAARYNARVAAALNQILLEKDEVGARFTLEGVKDDVIAKRMSRGRVQYVCGALVTAVGLCLAFWIAKVMYGVYSPTNALWLAARAGAVGALFSIAMNIRERKVQLDLNGRDNFADAALRVFVGAIGAGALTCLVHSDALPSATLGGSTFVGSKMSWEVVLAVGFAAGFSERLVTTMFEKFGNDTDPKKKIP
ncbi:hypothetical protein [Paraburkholderia strydomiana]|uniref:hypothetical protein n=1 Tax=Paraburkholderia strydomiana TaxID=1245417 RepID=UPI00286AF45D|nr:hypothetical protein [Paraburkholderia strydomiana]